MQKARQTTQKTTRTLQKQHTHKLHNRNSSIDSPQRNHSTPRQSAPSRDQHLRRKRTYTRRRIHILLSGVHQVGGGRSHTIKDRKDELGLSLPLCAKASAQARVMKPATSVMPTREGTARLCYSIANLTNQIKSNQIKSSSSLKSKLPQFSHPALHILFQRLALCKFYNMKGHCRFGKKCRFEHKRPNNAPRTLETSTSSFAKESKSSSKICKSLL